MAENRRPHEAPLKLDPDPAKVARKNQLLSATPMSSDRIYNVAIVEEAGRTQLISPPPEETLAFRRTSRSTPVSSASKRKRNITLPQQQLAQPNEATPNPKPRKQTRRQFTPLDSPTRPRVTPSKPNRNPFIQSPHALNPNANFVPPSASRSARTRRTTPIPPYEPPSDVFTPPKEVIMTPTVSKSSKRKTGPRPNPKSSAKTIKVIPPIKKELPDIDLSLPMPPPSPSDDPLLLSGPLLPPSSTPTRAPRQRKHVGVITSTSLILSPIPEPTHVFSSSETLPPSSEPDPLPSSGAEPPVHLNWDVPQLQTDDDDDSMGLDPGDVDVPAPTPLFPFSTWDEIETGGWSDSDDATPGPGNIIEVGEGEYTGRYHTLSVRTKLDPPSSATRVRMEEWGHPITPFPRKLVRPNFLAAPDKSWENAPAEPGQSDIQDTAQRTPNIGHIHSDDVKMVSEEDEDEQEAGTLSSALNGTDVSNSRETPADNLSSNDSQHAPRNQTSFRVPSPPPGALVEERVITTDCNEDYNEHFDPLNNQEEYRDNDHRRIIVAPTIEAKVTADTNSHPTLYDPNNYDGDTEYNRSDDDDDDETEEREVQDMSISYDEDESTEEQNQGQLTSIIFSPKNLTPLTSSICTPEQTFSSPPNAKTRDTQMWDEHKHTLNTGLVGAELQVNSEADADSGASSSDTEVDPDVVRITSADPRAAARAAAILKQHDYDCYIKHVSHQKDKRRKTVIGGGIHKIKTPTGKQRRATMGHGMGMIDDRVYVPGSPAMTLPELLRQAEAQVAENTSVKWNMFATPLLGPKAGFETPLITTPLPRRSSISVTQTREAGEQAWTKEEWKLLDACFTDERLERGINGTLAPVDAIHVDQVVVRFLALFDDVALWDRSTIQQRVKALQNKQRAGNVAPPTTPYTPLSAFDATRRIPSMEVPEFTPLGRRALPPRKQRTLPVLVADKTMDAPFANIPAEETELRTTAKKMPASLLAPRYSHLLEEAVAISTQPTSVADSSVASTTFQSDTTKNADIENTPLQVDFSAADDSNDAPPPQPTPTTLGTRVKGFLFSYLPRSKANTGVPQPNHKKPTQPGLPLPPPTILSKPRGPINTPVRAPVPKPTHPRDLVSLQPAPVPTRTSKIPRAARPQRLVELHPTQIPTPAPVVAPRPRRSSGGSVKDLVRCFEELDGAKVQAEAKRTDLKRVRSVGEWQKGLGGKTSGKPGWKP